MSKSKAKFESACEDHSYDEYLKEIENLKTQVKEIRAEAQRTNLCLEGRRKDILYYQKQIEAKDKRIDFYRKQLAMRDEEIAFNRAEIKRLSKSS